MTAISCLTTTSPFRAHYDVVIVGARVAGAATAMLLARAGLSVLAIDQGRYGSDARSTHIMMRAAVTQLARWDLLGDVIASGAPAIKKTTARYEDFELELPMKTKDGIDALYAPRRKVLDRVLVDAARAAGATVVHRTRFKEVVWEEGRVAGVIIEDSRGDSHSVKTPMLIGADGIGSAVAAAVGAKTQWEGEHATATLYSYWPRQSDGYGWSYKEGAIAGVVPTNDGLSCVFVSMPPERFRAELGDGPEALLRRVLAETAPEVAKELAEVPPAEAVRAFSGRVGHIRQSAGPGWALVGDASYFKDPCTAHGIADALIDAELLAEAVLLGGDQALADYQTTRDALAEKVMRLTDDIASLAHDMPSLQRKHGELAAALQEEMSEIRARWLRSSRRGVAA